MYFQSPKILQMTLVHTSESFQRAKTKLLLCAAGIITPLKGLLQQLHKRLFFGTKKETVLKFVGFCAQEGQQYSETGSLQIIRVPRNDFGFFFLAQFFRAQIFHRKFENFRKFHEILPWESLWESEITMFSNILKPVSCSLIPHLETFFDLY